MNIRLCACENYMNNVSTRSAIVEIELVLLLNERLNKFFPCLYVRYFTQRVQKTWHDLLLEDKNK